MTMHVKQHDLLPALVADLAGDTGPVDLTAATSIKVIGTQRGVALFSRTATGTSGGVVTMQWQTGDTANIGPINVEVEVTWPGSKPQSFPASGYMTVVVEADLG